MKEEVLSKIDFDHFSLKELLSDVRKSDLYSADRLMDRMEKLVDVEPGK